MPFYGSTATNPGRTGQGSRHADAEASGSLLATSTIGDTLLTAISFVTGGRRRWRMAHSAKPAGSREMCVRRQHCCGCAAAYGRLPKSMPETGAGGQAIGKYSSKGEGLVWGRTSWRTSRCVSRVEATSVGARRNWTPLSRRSMRVEPSWASSTGDGAIAKPAINLEIKLADATVGRQLTHNPDDPPSAAGLIRGRALALGFDAVGFCRAELGPEARSRLAEFLAAGQHGDMGWLARRIEQRSHPQSLWPAARSVIALGLSYAPEEDPLAALAKPDRGSISVYARNRDYHEVVKGG